jgi:DNA-directed RNA polymerase specialized sigma24 family protein
MLWLRQSKSAGLTSYATSEDFCRIFKEDAKRLYLLSFLLTGDQATAESCFVCGLGDAVDGSPVFKEWAQSWARRTIIRNAIRMIGPRATDNRAAILESNRGTGLAAFEPDEVTAVVALPAFERFVFVITVLEGYSNQECSLLFGCSRGEVTAARTEALRQLGRSAELRHKHANSIEAQREKPESAIGLGGISPLVASA